MKSDPEHRQAGRLCLQVFDVAVEIRSDSAGYLEPFSHLYHRFLRPEGAVAAGYVLPIQLFTFEDNAWQQPMLIVDGEEMRLEPRWLAGGYPYDLMQSALVAQVSSHILLHGGAVSWDGAGVVLCGDSGHGKTSLTLKLLERGFGFLSDDTAALRREDGRICPYPRGLHLPAETLELLGYPSELERAYRWAGGLLVDVDELQPGSLDGPARVRKVIFLMDESQEPPRPGDGLPRPLGVVVDRAEEALLEGVRQIRAVARMRTEEDRGYPLIRVWTEQRHQVLQEIQTLCAQQGVRVLDVIRRPVEPPAFQPETKLEPMPSSRALMELLRRFQGGPDSRLVQEVYQGNATRLFLELVALLDGVEFYRLTPGPLDEMADLVTELMTESGE